MKYLNFLKKTRLALITYKVIGTGDTGHCILTIKGYFWTVTKTVIFNSISKNCHELVDESNAVITDIKIVK